MRRGALGIAHVDALEAVENQAGNIEEWPSYKNYRMAEYVCDKHLVYRNHFTVLAPS